MTKLFVGTSIGIDSDPRELPNGWKQMLLQLCAVDEACFASLVASPAFLWFWFFGDIAVALWPSNVSLSLWLATWLWMSTWAGQQLRAANLLKLSHVMKQKTRPCRLNHLTLSPSVLELHRIALRTVVLTRGMWCGWKPAAKNLGRNWGVGAWRVSRCR